MLLSKCVLSIVHKKKKRSSGEVSGARGKKKKTFWWHFKAKTHTITNAC